MDLINRKVARERYHIEGSKIVGERQAASDYGVWLKTDSGSEYFANKVSVRRNFEGKVVAFETCGKYYVTDEQEAWENGASYY